MVTAGKSREQLPQHLINQPRYMGQHPRRSRTDELRVKTQGGVLRLALGMRISTQLSLGGRVSPKPG
jgi:hypothetical protein